MGRHSAAAPALHVAALLCFACVCSSVVATTSSGRGSSILLPFGLSRASASSKATTAKTPAISITTNSTENGGLSPVLTWSTSGAIASRSGRYNYEIGIDMEPLRSENLNAATNVFGRLSTTLDRNVIDQVGAESEAEGFEERRVDFLSRLLERKSKWDLAVRGDVNVQNLPNVDTINVEFEAHCEEREIGMKSFATIHQNQLGASPQNQLELRRLEISKRYGTMTINPRYFPTHAGAGGYADVYLTIERPNQTTIQIYACPEKQWLTIARRFGENLLVAPSISTAAARITPSIFFRHDVGDASSVINFSPQENINVEWRNGALSCNVIAPIKNNRIERVSVSVKKKMEF